MSIETATTVTRSPPGGSNVMTMPSLLIAVGVATGALAAAAGPAGAAAVPLPGFADLSERLLPAVVNVSTSQEVTSGGLPSFQFPPGSPFGDFFERFNERFAPPNQRSRKVQSLGSGFVIDPDGHVVTNNHVIANATSITVILQDGTEFEARVVGRDEKTDLALLKIETDRELPYVEFGDSDEARVGDWVIAIGNPYGFGGTVTAGIISARARDIQAGPYDDFLQIDAPINRGNSGGPLFNLAGEVIGVNTAIFSPTGASVGIGFAIPSAQAQPVLVQLRSFGAARRGWIGVRIQEVSEDIAKSLGLAQARGVLITSLYEGEPAALAGLRAGDVLLAFAGSEVSDLRSLRRIVADTEIGADVEVEAWRAGETLRLTLTVGSQESFESRFAAGGEPDAPSLPPGSGNRLRIESLGLELAALDTELRRRHRVEPAVRGVLITKVARNSPSARRGIVPGAVIVQAGQDEVDNPLAVARYVKGVIDNDGELVLFLIRHGNDVQFVTLRVAPG